MTRYCIEPKTKYVKGCGFLWFVRKYRKNLLDAVLDALETASIKVVYKASDATGWFIGNKITDKIVKKTL